MVRKIWLAGLSALVLCLACVAAPAPLPRRRPPDVVSGTYLMKWEDWQDCELILYSNGTYEHSFQNRNWRLSYSGYWDWNPRTRILRFHEFASLFVKAKTFICAFKKDAFESKSPHTEDSSNCSIVSEHFEPKRDE